MVNFLAINFLYSFEHCRISQALILFEFPSHHQRLSTVCHDLRGCLASSSVAAAERESSPEQSHVKPGLLVSYLEVNNICSAVSLRPFPNSSSFREYLACSETAVYKKCGWATASFTRKFMNQMAVPMIKEYCESNQEIVCDNKSTGSRSPAEFGTLIWLMMIMLVKMLLFC